MSSLIMYYFLFLCIAGFVVLSILSMMAFANLPCMNIKQGKNVNSGITLIITAIIYAVIGVSLYIKIRKSEKIEKDVAEINEVKINREYVRMPIDEDIAKTE